MLSGSYDGTAKKWDFQTGKEIFCIPLKQYDNNAHSVTGAAFVNQTKLLLSSSDSIMRLIGITYRIFLCYSISPFIPPFFFDEGYTQKAAHVCTHFTTTTLQFLSFGMMALGLLLVVWIIFLLLENFTKTANL